MGRQAELAALAALQELDADLRAELAALPGRIEAAQAELDTIVDRNAKKIAAQRARRARKKEKRAELAADGRARLGELVARQAELGEELRQAESRDAQWPEWPGVVAGLHEWDEARLAEELAALRGRIADVRAELAELPGRIEATQAELDTIANNEADRKAKKAAVERVRLARKKEERAELAADGRARLGELVARQAELGEELRQAESREAQWPEWPGVVAGLHEWDEARLAEELAALRGRIADVRAELAELPGRIEATRAELDTIADNEVDRKAKKAAVQRKWQAREREKWAEAEARLGELEARQAWLAALPVLDADRWAELAELPGRIEAAQAELDAIADRKAKKTAAQRKWRARKKEGWVVEGQVSSGGEGSSFAGGSPAVVSVPGDAPGGVVRPGVIVELAGLVGLMEGHLAVLPADFRPEVRAEVAEARKWTQLKGWTPQQLQRIASRLPGMGAAEQYLRNVRLLEEIPAGIMVAPPDAGEDLRAVARDVPVARAEPLLFGGFADPGEVIDRARGLVPDLPHIQVVGVHVVPGGWAVLPDGRLAAPEEFAEVVRGDERFRPGLVVALLGCAAHRGWVPGELTFGQRFARALGAWLWVADTDVFQTEDGGVHATEVSVTGDGRLWPAFVGGLGTGHWSLLDDQGQLLRRSGPELRAAIADSAVPSGEGVVEHGWQAGAEIEGPAIPHSVQGTHPAPVIRWTGTPGPSHTATPEEKKARKAAAERERRARKKKERAELAAERQAQLGKLVARQAALAALPELDADLRAEWAELAGRIKEVQAELARIANDEAEKKTKEATAVRERWAREKEERARADARLGELEARQAELAELAELAALQELDADLRAELAGLPRRIAEAQAKLDTMADRKARNAAAARKLRARALLGKLLARQAELAALPVLDADLRAEWVALPGRIAAARAEAGTKANDEAEKKAKEAAVQRERRAREKEDGAQAEARLGELVARQAELAALPELNAGLRAELAGLRRRIAEAQAKLDTMADRKARNAAAARKLRARARLGKLVARQEELTASPEMDAGLRAELTGLRRRIAEAQAELDTMANAEADTKAKQAAAQRERWACEKEKRALVNAQLGELMARRERFGEELRQAESREAEWAEWPELVAGLREWDEARLAAELAALRGRIEDLRAELVELAGRIEAAQAELDTIANDEAEKNAKQAAAVRERPTAELSGGGGSSFAGESAVVSLPASAEVVIDS
ncbi:hypothetical protein ACWDKQ_34070 [Saccharopolyspora sp. NPDC000995]